MKRNQHARLSQIQDFDTLVEYLRDEMDWPISTESFEDSTFDYGLDELGIDAKNAAKIQEIKRLRPFHPKQPWGIFFVKFEPKSLPVLALRSILGRFALKRHTLSNRRQLRRWEIEDLLFVSNYGQDEQRQITFAHFTPAPESQRAPVLKVLDWDSRDTHLHLEHINQQLTRCLTWPSNPDNAEAWRKQWKKAFTVQYRQTVNTSRDLSIRLAELAREIRERIKKALEIETEDGYVTMLLKSFQETLVGDIDHSSFADMVAQTVTYGLLSARITNPEQSTATDFTRYLRTNPLLNELMDVFLSMGTGENEINFDELGIVEIEDFLNHTNMESVVRDFGDRNPREDPVIHFYENFLAEYDKEKKVKRGVFYTPRPVVSYIVKSIDALLRSDFGLADGLADTSSWSEIEQKNENLRIPDNISPESDFVQILDPATGTGTFLVEVIEQIYSILTNKWENQGHNTEQIASLWNEYVPKHLLPRLYGYELMMAPYVIAHFKISLKLYETGYHFKSDERARIYLTNTLEPTRESAQLTYASAIPALANEGKEVDRIKNVTRFTVVLGNPPYSGESANKGTWIRELLRGHSGKRSVENYFNINKKPLKERNSKWLNDDYVKFIRFAHWQIERTGQGIVGFITNHAYLDNPTFRGMRESLATTFPVQYLLDLHGSTKKSSTAPDGGKDENVFDIQQGVAIGIFIKSVQLENSLCYHTDIWGKLELANHTGKYDFLETENVLTTEWVCISPVSPYWFFIPHDDKLWAEYTYTSGYHSLTDIFPINSVGIVTARDDLTIQFTEREMMCIVRKFVTLDPEDARSEYNLSKDSKNWKVKWAQEDILDRNGKVCPILYRPFDTRFTYYSGKSNGFICRPRPESMDHMLAGGNLALISCRQQSQVGVEWRNCGVTRTIVESCAISNKTKEINSLFPLYTFQKTIGTEGARVCDQTSNLNPNFKEAFRKAIGNDLSDPLSQEDIFAWIYSILHSISYRERYSEQLKYDFPHIPLPQNPDIFRTLTAAGHELIALHLLESPKLNDTVLTYTGSKNTEIKRVGWTDDFIWLDAEKVNAKKGYRAIKSGTFGFSGVPEKIWDYHVGSYQVCQKWLNDRKGTILSEEDIIHYSKIVSALGETISIMSKIDKTIETHGGWPTAFVGTPGIDQ